MFVEVLPTLIPAVLGAAIVADGFGGRSCLALRVTGLLLSLSSIVSLGASVAGFLVADMEPLLVPMLFVGQGVFLLQILWLFVRLAHLRSKTGVPPT